MIVECWTDGSGLATGGPGGWAYVLRAIDETGEVLREREDSGPLGHTTNQRAELNAVIRGLRALREPTAVIVASDSEYALDGFRKGWVERWQANGWRNREGEEVANRDLWEALAREVARHTVTWRHVKGHAKTYLCSTCGWLGDEPYRETPRARTRFCPACREGGRVVRVETRDKFPLNARCDELAGAQRRAQLERAQTTGNTERGVAVEVIAPGDGQAPSKPTLGPLTLAMLSVGYSYRRFKDAHAKAEPTALRASTEAWTLADEGSVECYGVTFSSLIGRLWWPKEKPAKEPAVIVDESIEGKEFVVA